MAKPPVLLWHWRLRNAMKRGGWEVLHWAMTEADAAEWARHNRVELEKVEGCRQKRYDYDGDAYGQSAASGFGIKKGSETDRSTGE